MSDFVCFQNNQRTSCDDICNNNDNNIFIVVFFFIVAISLLIRVIFEKSRQTSNNLNRINTNNDNVDQQTQCNIEYGMRTLTINPDNSFYFLSDIHENEPDIHENENAF